MTGPPALPSTWGWHLPPLHAAPKHEYPQALQVAESRPRSATHGGAPSAASTRGSSVVAASSAEGGGASDPSSMVLPSSVPQAASGGRRQKTASVRRSVTMN